MAQQLFSFKKFVQIEQGSGRTQCFGVDLNFRTFSGEIIARSADGRQVIANMMMNATTASHGEWKALKLEMYDDGSMPDFTEQSPSMAFVLQILPWNVWKVERCEGGMRWVPSACPGDKTGE